MPAARCKFYWSNGNPVRRGCPSTTCGFVHPEEKDLWDSLPPYKSTIRCKNFDNNGNPTGFCVDGSKFCRFVHPDDPRWAHAEPTLRLGKGRRTRSSEKHIVPAIPPLRRAESFAVSDRKPTVQDTARMLLPKLQTDMSQARSVNLAAQSGTVDLHVKHEDVDTFANELGRPLPSQRASGSGPAPVESSLSIRIPPLGSISSPVGPSSALSQTTDGSKLQAWKKLISLLAQVVNLREEMRDVDRRMSLHSVDISALELSDRAQLDSVLGVLDDHRNNLEDRLNTIITQLVETDLWPLLSEIEVRTPPEQGVHLDYYEGFTIRLDEVEAQLKKHTEVHALSGQNTKTPTDGVDIVEPSPRTLKRRRTSSNGVFMPISEVKHVLDRLDSAENKISEMREDDQITERIEELLEKIIQRSALSQMHTGEGLKHSHGRGVSSVEPLQFWELERDFMALCEELAGHLPAVGKLEAELGQLRLDITDQTQTVTTLGSSCAQMREQLDSLSHQILDISSEVINLRLIPDSPLSVAADRDYLIKAVGQDVEQHVATVRDEIMNLIASHSKNVWTVDIQDAVTRWLQTSSAMERWGHSEVALL